MRLFALRAACFSLLVAALAATGCEPEDRTIVPPTSPEPAVDEPGPTEAAVNGDIFHRHAYAEACVTDGDCASNLCHEARCTVACDESVANSCRDVDAFCVPELAHGFLCEGRIHTGDDIGDDRDIALGSPVRGRIDAAKDADMFELRLVAGMKYTVTTVPEIGDVRLEVYDELTKIDASIDTGGYGEKEEGSFIAPLTGNYYIVVRDVGGKPTGYALGISASE
jgi:hypothetical protein